MSPRGKFFLVIGLYTIVYVLAILLGFSFFLFVHALSYLFIRFGLFIVFSRLTKIETSQENIMPIRISPFFWFGTLFRTVLAMVEIGAGVKLLIAGGFCGQNLFCLLW